MLHKIVFAKQIIGGGQSEIWTMNYDGSNQTKINITLPAGQEIANLDPRLSPDGTKIFFVGRDMLINNNKDDIYSCNIDGSNVIKIYDMPEGTGHTGLGGVY